MPSIRPLRNVLLALRSSHLGFSSQAASVVELQPYSNEKNAFLAEIIRSYTKGLKLKQDLFSQTDLLSLVPLKISKIAPFERNVFAKAGAINYVNDVVTLLKDQTKPIDLDLFCMIFYRLVKLDEICQHRIVETCGLEPIVNLLQMIVERPEVVKEVKSIEVLCNAVSKLDVNPPDKPIDDRLKILLKPVISPLLSRILVCESVPLRDGPLCHALCRLLRILVDNVSDAEKVKIARLVWKEAEAVFGRGSQRHIYFTLFRLMDLFVKLDIKETKGSFEWVDKFLERWISCMRDNETKNSRMNAVMHFNFVLIGLQNGKYAVVGGQKRRWSEALRQARPFIGDSEIEIWRRYVEQLPTSDEIGKRLVNELNLLLK